MANEKRLIYLEDAKEALIGWEIDFTDDEIEYTLDHLPKVDAVEVVHGRWDDGECTACGFDIRDMIDGESDFRNWVWDGVPYCPNCGADMRGKEDA